MAAEYVEDVPYVRHFIGDLAPGRLRLVAAFNGVAPPPADELDYCELGCAHGDTLAALAAAHPRGRFLGVDLSETHIASAKKLAREGGLENVGFLARDFADLLDEDIGTFDYVVAYGVLSWISPEKRSALFRFAERKLKPGGLLYLSYNAMPGWAAVEPLRQLLLSPPGVSADETGTLERAERGVAFAEALASAGAEYFEKNPAAAEMLSSMRKAGLPYVVHEYLHEHWSPMYVARVAWEASASDLHFVGALPLFTNLRETAIPEGLEPSMRDIEDRIAFESLKDFATNEFFRRDVFVKGVVPRKPEFANTYFDSESWGTLASALPTPREVRFPHRTMKLEGKSLEALFDVASLGSVRIGDVASRSGQPIEKLRAALVRLLVADQIVPLRSCAPPAAVDGRFRIPAIYNQMMIRRLAGETPVVLVSEAAGTAFPISKLEGMAIRVLTEAEPDAREAWVDALVRKFVLRLAVGDRVYAEPEDQKRVILETVRELRTLRLAKLLELGILAL